MIEKDIFEDIIEIGKRRGKLTYDEINEAIPSEYSSPEELEELMELLHEMGIDVVDSEELDTSEEEALASEEEEVEHEKTEDIVQA